MPFLSAPSNLFSPHNSRQDEAQSPHSLPTRTPQPLALSTQAGTSDSQTGGADGEFGEQLPRLALSFSGDPEV